MRRLYPPRRTALAALALLPCLARAQNYPNKVITLVIPFAAGGGTDSIARDVAKTLSEKLGQPVIVDSKGGGGGSIGANAVAKAQADGYTLLVATSTFITNAAMEASSPYNVEKDFCADCDAWLWAAAGGGQQRTWGQKHHPGSRYGASPYTGAGLLLSGHWQHQPFGGNMFGDILSDLTAELSGSLGLGGSLNAGAKHAMDQAAHGSAPDIAGQNIANPLSLILSAGLLLGWHGQRKGLPAFAQASAAIEKVTAAAVQAHEVTRDVGGALGTREMGAAFVKRLLAY